MLADDAVQAADWPLWVEPHDGGQALPRTSAGLRSLARLLETVVLIFKSGDELVIHAMPARRQYWDLLPRIEADLTTSGSLTATTE